MKICPGCGMQSDDSALFCTGCGAKLESSETKTPPIVLNANSQPFQPAAPTDNRKTYSILAYIPVLWLFGLLSSPEKFDGRVKFNVGQGIMLTITGGALSIVAGILTLINNLIFRTQVSYFGFGTGEYTVSPVAGVLNTLVWIAVLGIVVFYAVYGIVKVSKDSDSYLPIIGKLAFYK